MRFIRAAEGNYLGVMCQALVAYANLYKLSADPLDKHLPHNGGLRPFRDHVVTLVQEQATRQLQEFQRDIPNTLKKPKRARAILCNSFAVSPQAARLISRQSAQRMAPSQLTPRSWPTLSRITGLEFFPLDTCMKHYLKNGFRKISPLMRALYPNRLFLPMIMIAGWSQKRTSSLPLIALRIHPRDLTAFLF